MGRGTNENRFMEWAERGAHMGGIPRKAVYLAVGAFAKSVASVVNGETLVRLVCRRPDGVPVITVSNHMSTLDDPLLWGVPDHRDICFRNTCSTSVRGTSKCILITRGGGIYQEHMNGALERLCDGDWVRLHTFPEGKVSQKDAPIRWLKWGTASLIVRAPTAPIVLPVIHHGFHEVMPENYYNDKRSLFPLCNKKIKIIVGDPMEFDIPKLKALAISRSSSLLLPTTGLPFDPTNGLDEAAQRCLYTIISEQIQTVMERLRRLLVTSPSPTNF